MDKKINCCDKCHTIDTEHTYPAHTTHDACTNPSCECHRNTEWHPKGIECENECHYQEPYGFVPEADCPVHDKT